MGISPAQKAWDGVYELPLRCSKFAESDAGNAKRFAARFQNLVKYVEGRGWCVWDGTRWNFNERKIMALAKEMADCILEECRLLDDAQAKTRFKHYLKSEQLPRLTAAYKLAESEPGMEVAADKFDSAPDQINAKNGIINLRTGELTEHRPDAFFSKVCSVNYNPDAEAPLHEQVINHVLPDPATQDYFQISLGYALSGHTAEQLVHYAKGNGGNGKSVLLETYLDILGDFGATISHDVFKITKAGGGANPEMVKTQGVRFLLTSEADNARINESLIKDLTGGDRVSVRQLYQVPIEFRPQFKLWVRGNYLPKIKGTDEGIWRRIRIVPFDVHIPEDRRDKYLNQKLKEEAEGIFTWLVRGSVKYYQHGLTPVKSVTHAVDDFRERMDVIGRFIAEQCVTGAEHRAIPSQLYKAFGRWAHGVGEYQVSERLFAEQLVKRGVERTRSNGKRWWSGIGFIDDQHESDGK